MKAILCKSFGHFSNLVYEDISSLEPLDKEVVISVKACGVNFPDTLIVQGKYQYKPDLPFSPGGEVSGIIKKIGSGVANLKIGERVIAFNTWGGFAEEIKVDANRIIKISEDIDYVSAAGLILTYGTSLHALKDRAKISNGETMLVLGASGGVGLSAIQLGKVFGAKVIACASSDEKLEICKSNGADEIINYSKQDLRACIKKLTNGKGVDIIYDPVGGKISELALRDMSWKGRYLVVGFATGDIPRIPLNLILLKGCSIIGVFWGAFTQKEGDLNLKNNHDLIQMYKEKKIKPHIHATFPLESAVEALNEVASKKVRGKVVLTVD